MLNTRRWPLTCLATLLTLALSLPAFGMSLDEAVASARQQSGGEVLSAHTVERAGRRMHMVRVLGPDGRVRRLRFPADESHPRGRR